MIDRLTSTILTIAVILQIVFIGITASKLEQDRKLIKALEKNTVSREKETRDIFDITNKFCRKKQRCESLYYQSPFFMISRFRQNFPFLYPQTKQINIDLFAHGAREVINKHNLALIEFYRKAIKHNNNSTFSPVFPQGNIGERPKERQFLRRGVK